MKSSGIPRTVTINGVRYKVRRSALETNGSCDPEKALILLGEDLATEAARSVFYHEVGHGSFYESGAAEAIRTLTPSPKRVEELLVNICFPTYRLALGVK